MDDVLTLLESAGISVKIRKCQVFCRSLDYLCHMLLPGLRAIAKDGTSAITNAKFPQGVIQIRSLLGACNVYRRFIKYLSHMAEPLNFWL